MDSEDFSFRAGGAASEVGGVGVFEGADVGCLEVAKVVLNGHMEDTIITLLKPNLLFQFWCPQRTPIAPVSVPLSPSPWVPQLDNLNLPVPRVQLIGSQHRVGMPAYNPIVQLGLNAVALVGRSTHDVVLSLPLDDLFKHVGFNLVHVGLGGGSAEDSEAFSGVAAYDVFVVEVQLCVGFFEKEDPELVSIGV